MTVKASPTIGVIGAGTMGAGIALVALYAGYDVILQDAFPHMLEKGKDYIAKFLEKKQLGERMNKIRLVERLEDLASAQVIIEAAPEQLALKQELFSRLDEICPPSTIFASNTSTLSVTAIAAGTQHPERVAGMHFFNPAPILPLVEVVRAAQSRPETVQALVDLATALGKTPVVTGDTPGFIVNRVARPFYGEALRLLGEGSASHEQIDAIVEQGGGFRMGPFKLMDLIGIDINAGAMRSMYEQTFGEPRYRPHWIQMQKLAAGTLGRKSGRGFYDYSAESKNAEPAASAVGKGSGRILISEGTWAPGLADLCAEVGYEVDSVSEPEQKPVACFVVAGRNEEAAQLLAWYDASLAPDVPLFIQCADLSLSECLTWVRNKHRLIGVDGLFFTNGPLVSLVAPEDLSAEIRGEVEALLATLGKTAGWINESPGLVLPRIVCQLANEAAFAQLEGVADGETIDLAMRLGVNYPRGPLEWGASIGFDKVQAVLDHLHAEYHEERYRACVLLRRWARELA
jgi:3-hydroxybutyryl-CoA dehydrogenase